MKTKPASTWLALFLVSYLPAFGATEVLLYDGTFTTTTNDHGFRFSGWERHLARSEYNASSATWPVGATNGPTPAFKFRHHLIHDNLPTVRLNGVPSLADYDGDGDLDIWLAKAWFENRDRGTAWIKHPVEFPELFRGKLPYGKSTRSVIIDIDRDGDNDIVFSECDDVDAKVGILENLQGNGTTWKLKLLPQTAPGRRCSLHALRVADFNQDGQLDIITVDQEDMMQNGIHSPRWYAFTQVGGEWKEQVLFDFGLGGHDIQIGDVDGDGDLDLVSKVWNPWKASANQGRSHADFLENLTIDRGIGRD